MNLPNNLKDVSKETREALSAMIKAFADLGTLREKKGITHAEMEAIYSVGLGFYRSGNYDDAEKVFNCLCLLDHVNSRFWTALGGVRQAKRDFVNAREAFRFAMILDIENLKAVYYLAECTLALGEKEVAVSMLRELQKLAKDQGEKGAAMYAKAGALKAKIESADGAAK